MVRDKRTILFVKIGIAGLGFMGVTHLDAFSKILDIEVAAISAESSRSLSGDLSQVGGNIERPKTAYDLSGARKYADWRELAKDPQVDIVDVCLPTDLHAPLSIAALEAGKHVLCEKPMALTTADCERMIEAAEKHGRVLMIGQVLRFFPAYCYLEEIVRSRRYGDIQSATFVRRCGVPDWSRWLPDESRSGGAVIDLLIHDIDQALWLFGMPDRVAAKRIGDGDTLMATFIYPNGPEVRVQGGWFPAGTPLFMGFQVRAASAEIELGSDGLVLSDGSGNRKPIDPPGPDGYDAEIAYFVDCCRAGGRPARCLPEESARALKVALLLKESRAAGGEQIKCSA